MVPSAIRMVRATIRSQRGNIPVFVATIFAGVPIFLTAFIRFMRAPTIRMVRTAIRGQCGDVPELVAAVFAEINVALCAFEKFVFSSSVGMVRTTIRGQSTHIQVCMPAKFTVDLAHEFNLLPIPACCMRNIANRTCFHRNYCLYVRPIDKKGQAY